MMSMSNKQMITLEIPTPDTFSQFRIIGWHEAVFDNGDGTTKAGGTCDYCGTGIRYVATIQGPQGGTCRIGQTCAERVGISKREWREAREFHLMNTPEAKARRKAAAEARETEAQAAEARRLAMKADQPWLPETVKPVDALFTLDGKLVTANVIPGKYGPVWKDGDTWVSAFPKRRSTMERKGYYEGVILVEAHANRRGGLTTVTDENWEPSRVVAIIDNGQVTPDGEAWGCHDTDGGWLDGFAWATADPAQAAATEAWEAHRARWAS